MTERIYKKNSQGFKDQLITNSVVLEQEHKNNRNMYIAYSDYGKPIDSVPHSWLIHVLQIYKLDPEIINSLQQLMKNWTNTLQIKVKNHRIISDPICIQRGIYQGDSLSPLWFYLALKHLSYLLKRTKHVFGIHCCKQETQRLNHLLYMDDIELYAATHNQLQELLRLTHTFSRDNKSYFGLKSAKYFALQRGNWRSQTSQQRMMTQWKP